MLLEELLNLPPFLGCLILIAIIVVVGLVIYLSSCKILFKGEHDTLGDATRTIFLAVNLLVGLFLSLTLNDVANNVSNIEDIVGREATAISDVYHGLKHIDSPLSGDIQLQLIDYTKALIEEEWPSLANDRLGHQAELLLRKIGSNLHLLETHSKMEDRSWMRISEDLDSISNYRLERLHYALAPTPFFLLVVICGMVVVMICLGVYRPTQSLVILVSFYLSFVGLTIYLILSLSDPFQGIPGVDHASLKNVLTELLSIQKSAL